MADELSKNVLENVKTNQEKQNILTDKIPGSRELEGSFLAAAEEGNIDVLQALLREGHDKDSSKLLLLAADKDMCTALHIAADNGRVDVVKYLVEQGADIGAVDKNGMAAIQHAAKSGNLDIVKYCVDDKKVDFKRNDNFGMTALSWAAKSGFLDVVQYLVRKGSDINALDAEKKTSLQHAVEASKWLVVKFLVGQGADINISDKYGIVALQRVMQARNWDMVRYLIDMGADVNVLDGRNVSPVQNAVTAREWNTAKYMVEKGANINNLTLDQRSVLLDMVTGQNIDEYSGCYNVIRCGNSELLEMFIEKTWGNHDSDSTKQKYDTVLAKTYEELKLKNVPLLPDIEFLVQDKIITSRFFTSKTVKNKQLVQASVEDVKKRIEMVCDQIGKLHNEYSGEEGKDFDGEFLLTSRFVAQNIHVLKRQLKSTYNKLPWEEMEFCLINFISTHTKITDSNSTYKLVLDKEKVLMHLSNFSDELNEVKSHINKIDVNSKFPQKQDPTLSARSNAFNSVISNNPLFLELYNDFEIIKNIYSLQRIESYIKLALSINLDEKQDLGKLVIERTLQVIGESLKNTIESPNVSDNIHDRLLASAPLNVREIITSLRDSLSHSHTIKSKIELEERKDIEFFYRIQNDLEKVEIEIVDILFKTKLVVIRTFMNKIATSKSLVEIKNFASHIDEIDFGDIITVESTESKELKEIKKLIKELNGKIKNKTENEKSCFEKINEVINSQESRLEEAKGNFEYEGRYLRGLINRIRFADDAQTIQQLARNMVSTEKIQPNKLTNVVQLVHEISRSVELRTQKKEFEQIVEICYKITYHVEFEAGRVKGIDGFKEQLENKETASQDSAKKTINFVFEEVERSLDTEEHRLTFRKELQNRIQSYEAKLGINSLLNQLKRGSTSHNDPLVKQKYNDLSKFLGLKKPKKQMLDQKFNSVDWDECIKILKNVRDNYEIFLNSVQNSLENEKFHDLSKPFKDLFTSIFQNSELLNKLSSNIDHILQESNKQLESFFEKRLTILSQFVSENQNMELVEACKQDKLLKSGVEMLVLDLTEILENVSFFGDNRLFFDKYSPLLIGKSLRNYIAHGDSLIDLLPFDQSTAIISTALKLIEQGTHLVTNENVLIGKKIEANPSDLNDRYTRSLQLVVVQKNMFTEAKNGNIAGVKDCITKGADLHGRDSDGWSGLHFAAAGDNVQVLRFFIDNNVSIHIKTLLGQTILHVAALFGSNNIIKYLMEQKKLPIDDVTHANITPLLFAASFGHADVVQTLLDNGADIEASDKENISPLHHSSNYGHIEVVQVLLDNKGDVNALSKSNLTPLHYAMYNNHMDVIAFLIRRGANVDVRTNDNMPLLHFTLSIGQKDIVKLLLQKGANVHEVSQGNTAPLHIAAMIGQSDIVEDLLAKGANIDAQNDIGWTPLHYASIHGHRDVAKVLLDHGANPFVLNKDNATPLHFAATAGEKDIVEYLLDKGANIDCLNKDNWTPLLLAANDNRKVVVVALLERGSNVGAFNKEKWTALHCASLHGFKDVVEALLERGADANAIDYDFMTPLHFATWNDHIAVVEILLENGANVNSLDNDNRTPLYCAVSKGSSEIIEVLLRRGANIDSLSKNNLTPLHLAAEIGRKEIVDILLKRGANINTLTDKDWTPLHYAAGNGHSDVVKSLLSKDAHIDVSTLSNMTPLHLASLSGHKEIVEALLAKGANNVAVSDQNNTPLHFASLTGHTAVVEALLRKDGANVDIVCVGGITALHLAAQSGHRDTVELLLEKGANINARTEDGWIPLHYAAKSGNKDLVKLLIEKGADINAQTEDGWEALHHAAAPGHNDVVKVLIENGANISAQTKDGFTSLHFAASTGHNDVVVTLLKTGDNVNVADNVNRRPLHYAATNGHRDVVERILETGANVDAVDNDGMTPLLYAARNGNTYIVHALLEHKANVNLINKDNLTALLYAVRNSYQEIIDNLLEKGANVESLDIDKMSPLHNAVIKGNKSIVEALLKGNANVNASDKNKCTPLHYAARGGHKNITQLLLEHEANVNAWDANNLTPLHYSARNGHLDVLEILLQKGADINTFDLNERTPLHFASRKGDKNVILALLDGGANINAPDNDNWTPLFYAVVSGHTDAVETLLQKGANVDTLDKNNMNPLDYAVFKGHTDIVDAITLRKKYIELLSKATTSLHVAAIIGQTDVVKSLIEKKVDVDALDAAGWAPLHYAANHAYNDIVRALLEAEANVDVVNVDNETPLHIAANKGHTDIVKVLIDKGSNVDAQGKSNYTPLHYSAHAGHSDVVEALLHNGAKIDAIDKSNWTPLHIAASEGHKTVVSALLEKGSNVNSRTKDNVTALLIAASHRKSDIVEMLLDGGSIIDAVTEENLTPLHYAAYFGDRKVANALLAKGSNIGSLTKAGVSPLHLAAENGHVELVTDLLKRGASIETPTVDNVTPLHSALQNGHKEVVFTLLDNKANFLAKNNHDSVLHRAVSGNIVEVIKHLIDMMKERFNQDPIQLNQYINAKDAEGDTPLMWAAEGGKFEAAKTLLEYGAEIDAQNNSGSTALHWAATNGHVQVVHLLIDQKANANIKDSNGKTAYDIAQDKSSDATSDVDKYEIITALLMSIKDDASILEETTASRQQLSETDVRSLESLGASVGANCNPQRRKKRSVWHCTEEGLERVVTKTEWDDAVKWLIEDKGADVNVIGEFGRTVLHRAAEMGNLPLVKWLVDKGANVNAKDIYDTTVLHFAAVSDTLELVRWLVDEKHVQVNEVDKFGKTALHFSALYGYKDVVEYLLPKGVNLALRDRNQDTAQDLAKKAGQSEIVSLLQITNTRVEGLQEVDVLTQRLADLQSEQEKLGLEQLGSAFTGSSCNSVHRRKRKIGRCTDKESEILFPYEPLDEFENKELAHFAKLYTHVAMAVALEHPSQFVQGNVNEALDVITTYNRYIGDIASEPTVHHSPREQQLLHDHYTSVKQFFKDYPEMTLLNKIDKGKAHKSSDNKNWLFDNNRHSMVMLFCDDRYQLYSTDFNYQQRFQTRQHLTFEDVEGFMKAFFIWRSGTSEYETFTLEQSLLKKLVLRLKNELIWTPDRVLPDVLLLVKDHLGLIESLPAEMVRKTFLLRGKTPDLSALHPDFFLQHKGTISVRIETLHYVLPSLTETEVQALLDVVGKYDFAADVSYVKQVSAEQRALLESYDNLVMREMKTARIISMERLSELSWAALNEEIGRHPGISTQLREKVLTSSKELHGYAIGRAWVKGMTTQTLFFLPDIIRATNTGDVTNLAQIGGMLTGDATINNLYTGLINNLETVLPEGRLRLLRALPITSPVFKALTVYSIIELTKQLRTLPGSSETRGIIEHKLGEQYMTAGLMVAELLGFEVTPLWIGLIAEQLIFDADTFRKQNHLDIPFWEAFIMSLGFEQSKLHAIVEKRHLVDVNLSTINDLDRQAQIPYGWVIIKIPKLDDLVWKNVSQDQVPSNIKQKVNSNKDSFSPKADKVTTVDGFRLVNKYKLETISAYSTVQVTRGKLLRSFWQKSVHRANPHKVNIKFSLHFNEFKSFGQQDNIFLDEMLADNVVFKRVPSISGGRFANGMDPVNRIVMGAAVYVNINTFLDTRAQSNFYVGFDPREGDLELEFTSAGLEKIDDMNVVHNLRAESSTMYNSLRSTSAYIVTIQVGFKPYPNTIEFPTTEGSFSLMDESERVISQYLITGDINYSIQDFATVARLVLRASLLGKQMVVDSSCKTVNDNGPGIIVVKTWHCTKGIHGQDKAQQLKPTNQGFISLLGNKKYLQLYISGHVIEKQLSLSAEHIDIFEAEGLFGNASTIEVADKVESFNITIRGNIIINNGPTRMQVIGKLPVQSSSVVYSQAANNKIMSFHEIVVEELTSVLDTMSRINTSSMNKHNLDIQFSTAGLGFIWQNQMPESNLLKIEGKLDRKSAVLRIEKNLDALSIVADDNRLSRVEINHYDQIGMLEKGLKLQNILTPGETNSTEVDGNHQMEYLGEISSLMHSNVPSSLATGNILAFQSPDGHYVYHRFPSRDNIILNGITYSIENQKICAVDGKEHSIDGRKLIKITKNQNQMNIINEGKLVRVCFDKSLKQSKIVVRHETLVINGLSLQHLSDNTQIYFAGKEGFPVKALKYGLERGHFNITASVHEHMHKRSVFKNKSQDYVVDLSSRSSTIKHNQSHISSVIFINVSPGELKVTASKNDVLFTTSGTSYTLRIEYWQKSNLETRRAGISVLKFSHAGQIIELGGIDRFQLSEIAQLQTLLERAEVSYKINEQLEQVNPQLVKVFKYLLANSCTSNEEMYHCFGFKTIEEHQQFVASHHSKYDKEQLKDIVQHEQAVPAFIWLVSKLYNKHLLRNYQGKALEFLDVMDRHFSALCDTTLICHLLTLLDDGDVVGQITMFTKLHQDKIKEILRCYLDTHPMYSDAVNQGRQVAHRHVSDASHENVSNIASSLSSSSINTMFNWVKERSYLFVTNVLSSISPINRWFISNNLYALPSESDNLPFNPTYSYSRAFSQLNFNETIVLTDFLIRMCTKVKPFTTKQQAMSLLDVQVCALNITSAFCDVLEQLSEVRNISKAKIKFNPVTLQSRLISVITNGNGYQLSQILVEYLRHTELGIKEAGFFSCLEEKLEEMLSTTIAGLGPNQHPGSKESYQEGSEMFLENIVRSKLELECCYITNKERYVDIDFGNRQDLIHS